MGSLLWVIFVILLAAWIALWAAQVTFGGLVHLFLVAAVIVLIIRLLTGRRVV